MMTVREIIETTFDGAGELVALALVLACIAAWIAILG